MKASPRFDDLVANVEWSTRARGALFDDRSSYEACGHGVSSCRSWGVTANCYSVRRLKYPRFGPAETIAHHLGKSPQELTLRELSDRLTTRTLRRRPGVGKGTITEIVNTLGSAGLRLNDHHNGCGDPRCKGCL